MTDNFSPPVPPDPMARTVIVPARVTDKGTMVFFYGGALPTLRPGTICEINVPAYAVEDWRTLAMLEHTQTETLLETGQSVLVLVKVDDTSPSKLTEQMSDHLLIPPDWMLSWTQIVHAHFVRVILREPLRLRLRATKQAELLACKCHVPALSEDADSINHAYTLISQVSEKHRRSHTGNVFDRVYVPLNDVQLPTVSDERRNPHPRYRSGIPEVSHQMNNEPYNRHKRWPTLGMLRNAMVSTTVVYRLLVLCGDWWYRYVSGIHQKPTWAYMERKHDDQVTIHLIDTESRIFGELYFRTAEEANASLLADGYKKFDTTHAPKDLVQPSPPYHQPNGQEVSFDVTLPWQTIP